MPSDAVMDRKMLVTDIPRPVGIDGLLASLSSIVAFSVTFKFAILVHWLVLVASVLMLKGTFIICF